MFRIAMLDYQLLSHKFQCLQSAAQRHLPVPAAQAIAKACHCIVWRELKIVWQTLETFGANPNTHIPTHILSDWEAIEVCWDKNI